MRLPNDAPETTPRLCLPPAPLVTDDHRFQALVEAGADAVLVVGRDGLIAYANPAAAQLMGRARHELVGHPFGVPIVPGETAEVDLHRPDGSSRVAEMRSSAVAWTTGAAYFASLRDITDRKRAEEALAEAHRRKDEFLAMLGHELRNPLAPIRASLELPALRAESTAAIRHAREVIDRQVTHMTRLVDDLLDVSRITRGKLILRRERIDAVAVARATAEDRRPGFEQKGVALELELPDSPLWVSADPLRLAQVMDNLLENARKFTDPGGCVRVSAAAEGGCAVLRVRDTGIGIDPGMLPHVFDTFTQADRTLDRALGGLGLGLAIVKGMVECHGGSVSAASPGVGHGSEFSFTLPLAEPEARPAPGPQPPGRPQASRRLRVLLVDDNRDSADILRELLEITGHEVEVAYSGPEGLAQAALFRPEVVVCDIGLPGLDGYAVAAALRADRSTASARLIAVTGYGRDEDREKALAAGFDDHLVKPVPPHVLFEKLTG